MTGRSDQYIKARAEAERLLRELGINELPIDPFEIARRLGIELQPLPANSGGASGMLIHTAGEFGICYPMHVDNEGFKNFSVAHEIGHYWLPGHPDVVLNSHGQHVSHAEFKSLDPYEKEADHFAAGLLMPTKLFAEAARSAGEGLKAIETLAAICGTSTEATAIRFTQIIREPVAVIRSEGKTIDYACMSDSLKDIPNLEWIRKNTPLPHTSVTATFNADRNNVESGGREEGTSTIQDWFNGPHRQTIVEEVLGLGNYGKTLTVLSGIESPDDFDEDDDMEESWTPRFRR